MREEEKLNLLFNYKLFKRTNFTSDFHFVIPREMEQSQVIDQQ